MTLKSSSTRRELSENLETQSILGSTFLHHTALTTTEVGQIAAWLVKALGVSDWSGRHRLAKSLAPAKAWTVVVADRNKQKWQQSAGNVLIQQQLEDRALQDLLFSPDQGPTKDKSTRDVDKDAVEVLEYLLFHQESVRGLGCLNVWGLNAGPHQEGWDPQTLYAQSYDPDPMDSPALEELSRKAAPDFYNVSVRLC